VLPPRRPDQTPRWSELSSFVVVLDEDHHSVGVAHHMYRVIVGGGSDVLVQGGFYFPDPTPAQIDGARAGGGFYFPDPTPAQIDGARAVGGPLMTGWIGVGLMVEFRVNGKRIVTSPVVAIATRRPAFSAAHGRVN
jgi:hypothetical protein